MKSLIGSYKTFNVWGDSLSPTIRWFSKNQIVSLNLAWAICSHDFRSYLRILKSPHRSSTSPFHTTSHRSLETLRCIRLSSKKHLPINRLPRSQKFKLHLGSPIKGHHMYVLHPSVMWRPTSLVHLSSVNLLGSPRTSSRVPHHQPFKELLRQAFLEPYCSSLRRHLNVLPKSNTLFRTQLKLLLFRSFIYTSRTHQSRSIFCKLRAKGFVRKFSPRRNPFSFLAATRFELSSQPPLFRKLIAIPLEVLNVPRVNSHGRLRPLGKSLLLPTRALEALSRGWASWVRNKSTESFISWSQRTKRLGRAVTGNSTVTLTIPSTNHLKRCLLPVSPRQRYKNPLSHLPQLNSVLRKKVPLPLTYELFKSRYWRLISFRRKRGYVNRFQYVHKLRLLPSSTPVKLINFTLRRRPIPRPFFRNPLKTRLGLKLLISVIRRHSKLTLFNRRQRPLSGYDRISRYLMRRRSLTLRIMLKRPRRGLRRKKPFSFRIRKQRPKSKVLQILSSPRLSKKYATWLSINTRKRKSLTGIRFSDTSLNLRLDLVDLSRDAFARRPQNLLFSNSASYFPLEVISSPERSSISILTSFISYGRSIDTSLIKSRSPRFSPKYSFAFVSSPFSFIHYTLVSLTHTSDVVRSKTKTYFKNLVFPDADSVKASVFRRLNKQRSLLQNRARLTSLLFTKRDSRRRTKTSILASKSDCRHGLYESSTASWKHNLISSLDDTYRPIHRINYLMRRRFRSPITPRIRRIRFKPGYGRIWRTARVSVRDILNIPVRYQYRLTPKLQKLYFKLRSTQSKFLPLTVGYALMTGRFAFDRLTLHDLLDSSTVFLNGTLCTNSRIRLFVNDFLQLTVNLKFYLILRILKNGTAARRFRLNRIFYRKTRSIDYRKFYKTPKSSRNLPSYFFDLEYAQSDVPKYFEADYFSLSLFVVHDHLMSERWLPIRSFTYNPLTLNMYNWKYIT